MQKTQLKPNPISLNKIFKFFIRVLLILIITMVIVPLLVILIATKKVSYAGNAVEHPLQDIYQASDFGLVTKELKLTTADGLNVWASEVLVTKPKAIIIYLSGIQQPSVTYFYGHSKLMKQNEYASILLEVRGHGESEGKVSLGYKEVEDVKAVVRYIKEQEKYNTVPIIIHGVSMGGAIAINSFGELKEVDGLVAMSAYASFEDVIYDRMRRCIPSFICKIEKSITRMWLSIVFGSEVAEITPINQINKVGNRPALLIACRDDTEVAPINMQRLLNIAPKTCTGWLRDSWEHFIVKDCDFKNIEQDKEYCNKILSFIKEIVE